MLIRTTDAGVTWQYQDHGTNNILNSIYFSDVSTGWAVGENGTILKTTNGGVTFISGESNNTPQDFNLYQNYPNPFNPSTNIKFRVPQRTNVSLIVYDMLGRKISTLFEGVKEVGEYNIEFKPDNISSGMYIYQLRTSNNTITKKMIYLK